MKYSGSTGIVSYGTALPIHYLSTAEIEKVHNAPGMGQSLGIQTKTVPEKDEDTITLSIRALSQALRRSKTDIRADVSALFIGSESHPYAVKPSGTVVAQALGLGPNLAMADMQFACKAGTQAMQVGLNYIESGASQYTIAIGSDTAQGAPGNALEYSAAAGAAAFILGKIPDLVLAKILFSTSLATDTPDFWRRPTQQYPQHAGRFSGEPAYMTHIITNTKNVLHEAQMKISDFEYIVFHTPNKKFPQAVAHSLGCSAEQLRYSLIVEHIGNTYAAASLLALTNVLDHAKAHEKILLVSYGSGAGSDSFILETTDTLVKERAQWTDLIEHQISRLTPISYPDYLARK